MCNRSALALLGQEAGGNLVRRGEGDAYITGKGSCGVKLFNNFIIS